jgi:hypothetical protein
VVEGLVRRAAHVCQQQPVVRGIGVFHQHQCGGRSGRGGFASQWFPALSLLPRVGDLGFCTRGQVFVHPYLKEGASAERVMHLVPCHCHVRVHRCQVALQLCPVGPDPVEARVQEVVPGCREVCQLMGCLRHILVPSKCV